MRVDRTRKIPVTVLLRSIGYGGNQEILDLYDHDPRILGLLEKDHTDSTQAALLEIYKRLRPGEPLNVDNARSLFESLFFDSKRYDFAQVGRYKVNKKLSLMNRIVNREPAEDIVDPLSREVLFPAGTVLGEAAVQKILEHKINKVRIKNSKGGVSLVIGNDGVSGDQSISWPMILWLRSVTF